MTHCKGCGAALHKGDLCQLCELKASKIEIVYVTDADNIIWWQSFSSEICNIPLDVNDFINRVRQQYGENDG